jgi:hypothetical protein
VGIQVSSAAGATKITQGEAMRIAEKNTPAGATGVAVRHVFYGKTGAKEPVEAWMITFRGAKLPGAGGATTGKIGSVSVMVDVTSGKVLDTFAYEPEAK